MKATEAKAVERASKREGGGEVCSMGARARGEGKGDEEGDELIRHG